MKKDLNRDLKDIEYFIDHVFNIDARIDVLQKMGYKIGVNVVNEQTNIVKRIIIGKKGEFRIQIAPAPKGLPLAKCVILE